MLPGVYPHVYGGTFSSGVTGGVGSGLSPCVWGHLDLSTEVNQLAGSIPMCMGAPQC